MYHRLADPVKLCCDEISTPAAFANLLTKSRTP